MCGRQHNTHSFSHLELVTDEAITQNKVFLYSLFAGAVINKAAVPYLIFMNALMGIIRVLWKHYEVM